MAKRITDKMRLDWLQKQKLSANWSVAGWWIATMGATEEHKLIRQAIDSQIRASAPLTKRGKK